ncbi:hypothetical protein GCM10009555_041480 [Acrocarpospora macrocephala]|uniref:DUF3618 domain-containing protein n=1 Tax=Acrocarpospora macrocephala TaxID=150177 RepID=A0A5M3WRG3_9ACTN|nr:DUF3618 domain-containing protein [Acrocarpospora macrocephala]GES09881.1 hypothetical protein Amac_034770 [Acrocarpospora macrocephala]
MADTDPEALERKIERTRTELARTVDAIADRVSPKRVAERNVARVKAQAEHVVTTIGDFVGGGAQRPNGAGRGLGATSPVANGAAPAAANGAASPGEAEGWEDEYPPPNIAPILIGVGVALAIGAAIIIMRRRRR